MILQTPDRRRRAQSLPFLTIPLIGTSLFCSFFLPSKEKIELSARKMLPQGEEIKKIREVKGGCANDLWLIKTQREEFVLRVPKKKEKSSRFIQILDITKHTSASGISPKIVSESIDEQHMLLEYIEKGKWPSYEENAKPYQQTMHVLRNFHEQMRALFPLEEGALFAPFDLIFSIGQTLQESADTPSHYATALEKTHCIFEMLKAQFKEHTTLCHGDFHRGNVILDTHAALKPLLIDFDSTSIGDPLFDVCKFSITLPQEERLKLLCEYLNTSFPTKEELSHFDLIDLSLLMVVATVRLQAANQSKSAFDKKLTKTEAEELLNSDQPLPPFHSIPFENASCKSRQLGALYALSEFLKRSQELFY